MKVAVIDLGTNTFNLFCAEYSEGNYRIIHKEKKAVKLGEGGIQQGMIADAAYQRGIVALGDYAQKINDLGIVHIKALATSAMRNAKNGTTFCNEVKKKYNIEIEVIDGLREAELIYNGAKNAHTIDKTILIMDIGGGSTEFIIANENEILYSQSFEIGAARLLATIAPSNPMTTLQVTEAEEFLIRQLTPLFEACNLYQPSTLIGCSGSFESFTEIMLHESNSIELLENVNAYPIPLDNYARIHHFLIHSTSNERLNTPGIIPMRVDMIVLASILTNVVLHKANIDHVYLSKFAMKEGAFFEMVERLD